MVQSREGTVRRLREFENGNPAARLGHAQVQLANLDHTVLWGNTHERLAPFTALAR
jgi:hypothetical protein